MTPLARLQSLLRDLFQLDRSELDFGIYRLFGLQRHQIQAFLEEQLPRTVGDAFAAMDRARSDELGAELEEARKGLEQEFPDREIANPDGALSDEIRAAPGRTIQDLVARYQHACDALTEVEASDEQAADVFNHLHAFFSRYYDEGDFVPRRHYGAREHYAIPYNGEETHFHWANRGQHYVKSAEVLRDYAFTVPADLLGGDRRVRFVLTSGSTPPGDTKGDTRYFFPSADQVKWDDDGATLVIPFNYRRPTAGEVDRHGRKIQQELLEEALPDLLDAVPDDALRGAIAHRADPNDDGSPTLLERQLRRFVRRSTSDYFVHRDLGGFLERELEFYIKDQVLHLADLDGRLDARLRTIRVLRNVAGEIIAFLASIEDVQKRLFEKRKFVLRTDYLVLLDAVPRELWEQVVANERQLDRWEALFEVTREDVLTDQGELDTDFLESRPTLVVDTELFDEHFTERVLSAFDDLDDATGGVLIHSENYQALRLIQPKYAERVKCIYIDPPYNTGSDDFIYKDRYQHSTWLTMMEERLRLARQMLPDDGVIFISIDDNEQPQLRGLLDGVFGENNFIDTVIWQKVFSPKNTARQFSADHDFLIVYAADGMAWVPNLLPRDERARSRYSNPDDDPRGPWTSGDLAARNYYSEGEYTVRSPTGETFSNPEGTYWRVSKQKFEKLDEDGRIWWGEDGSNVPRLKRFLSEVRSGVIPQTLWKYKEVGHTQEAKKELMSLVSFPRTEDVLQTVKPTRLLRRVVHIGAGDGDTVMDFFAGSGSTGHAAIAHARATGKKTPFVLVEAGEYFETIIDQRIHRALYAPEWKSRSPRRLPNEEEVERTPRLIKLLSLESYDDALHNLVAADTIEAAEPRAEAHEWAMGEDSYRLRYLARLPLESSATMLNVERLAHPFSYTLETLTDDGPSVRSVDLVETFNLAYGLHVERMVLWTNEDDETEDGGRRYRAAIGRDREDRRTLILWREMDGLDPAVERAFLEARLAKADPPYERVLINGDTATPGVDSLDSLFKRLIEDGDE